MGGLWWGAFAMDYCGYCRLLHCTRVCPQHTEVLGQIVLGHVVTDSRAVFSSMTDFHAVWTYNCSIPETSFAVVSVTRAHLTDEEGGGV